MERYSTVQSSQTNIMLLKERPSYIHFLDLKDLEFEGKVFKVIAHNYRAAVPPTQGHQISDKTRDEELARGFLHTTIRH